MKRTRSTQITKILDRRQVIREERRQITKCVCCSAKPVGIHTDKTDLAAELETVFAAYPVQAVDQPYRVRRVGLSSAIGRRVCSNKTARDRYTRRCALAGNAGVCDT